MKTWSIYAGRIFGVELRIHATFFLLLLFTLFINETSNPTVASMQRGLILVAVIFGSVVLHELGHAVVSRRNGLPVKGIMLLPIGGIILVDPNAQADSTRDAAREVRIALAGPVVNGVLAVGAAAVLLLVLHMSFASFWTKPLIGTGALGRSVFWINFFLCVFNLLPAFPMDGGRILRAWMARRTDFQQATRRAVNVGHLFAAAFMFTGIIVSPWLMLFGLFMFVAAQLEERTVLFQSVVEAVRMEDIMLTDFSILSPADTLEDALSKAVHSLQDDFPVVRGGDLVGVINRQTILERLRREGNGYVQAAMNKAFEVAARTESLASAFRKLTSRGLTLIPVVDQERLVGIVTLQNLMHSMALLAESRRLRKQADEANA
jgi:Zn-dependent protease/predicted transcriptional regulator